MSFLSPVSHRELGISTISNGTLDTMIDDITTTIDGAGRVVIPKSLREEAGLFSGTRLQIRLRGGLIEIEAEPREVMIVQQGKLHVAVPVGESETLIRETVENVRRKVRSERNER